MPTQNCKHPTCNGEFCRRPVKEKKVYYLKRSPLKKKPCKIKKVSAVSLQGKVLEAQKVFNLWIRNRDKDLGCISCGSVCLKEAGHYISAGANTLLRFHEWNVNGQCIKCNRFLGGNYEYYRVGLIKKIGLHNILQLEAFLNKPKRWTQNELDKIIEKYK
jgi:hypothetical protein